MMDPLFPELPDLSTLDDDALAAALQAHLDVTAQIEAGDLGDRNMADVLDALQAGVAAIDAMRAEQHQRDDTRAAAEAEMAELLARARDDQPAEAAQDDEDEPDTGDDGDQPDDGGGDAEPAPGTDVNVNVNAEVAEPVLADARRARLARVSAKRPAAMRPVQADDDRRVRVVAAGDVRGFSAGQEFQTEHQVAEAIVNKWDAIKNGGEGKFVVATIQKPYPEERVLPAGQPQAAWRKIEDVVGQDALVATGGICAPREPYYGLMAFSDDDRPVRDSLPSFNAARGGIQFAAPPALSAVTTAVGTVTAAQDLAGGTSAVKTCQTIVCPSLSTVDLAMIYHCLKFGNLGARTWPEQVEQFTDLVMAAHARVAETRILDAIDAASTQVTAAQVAGAINTLLGQVLTAAAGMRSRHRMAKNTRLRAIFPLWALDMLLVDLLRSQFGRFDVTRDGLTALLRSFDIEITFTLDGPTGGGQVFGAQAGGALLGFPATVKWYLFPEGSFVFLDGGTLDLGVVRDSTLNLTNDFQMFGETFENTAFVGVESLEVTSTACANGQVTLPTSASSNCQA